MLHGPAPTAQSAGKRGFMWMIFLSEIREYQGEGIPEDQKVAPVVILSCLVCGHIEYISPKILKITGF